MGEQDILSASPNCWTLWPTVQDVRKEILVPAFQTKPSHKFLGTVLLAKVRKLR